MGKKSPSAPAAPDPVTTAAAQSGANRDAIKASAEFNQFNQRTPFGTVSYSGAIGSPNRTMITSLNPQDQKALDMQRGLGLQLTGLSQNALKQVPTNKFTLGGIDTIDKRRADQLTNDMYGRYSGKINEQYGRDAESLRTQLVNQGINVGNDAYGRATGDLNQSRDAALRDAYGAALMEGRNDVSMQQGIRNQQIQDRLLERSQPYNEAAAFLQGAPIFNNAPQGSQTQYQVAPADVMGAYNTQYQGALNNYNQRTGSNNAKMGSTAGLAGALGGAAIMASSRTFKEGGEAVEEENVLQALEQLPIERWHYKGEERAHIGCYAEDFAELFGVGDGMSIHAVDAIGVCMAAIKALSDKVKTLEAAQHV